jgi:hypothetical protein
MSTSSMAGLSRAVMPPSGGPFDPATDPDGTALMQRAAAARQADHLSQMGLDYGLSGPGGGVGQVLGQAVHQMGPLPDPRWDGYFEAVNEAAGGKPVSFAGSSGPDLGYDTNNGTFLAGAETYGPKGLKLRGVS